MIVGLSVFDKFTIERLLALENYFKNSKIIGLTALEKLKFEKFVKKSKSTIMGLLDPEICLKIHYLSIISSSKYISKKLKIFNC